MGMVLPIYFHIVRAFSYLVISESPKTSKLPCGSSRTTYQYISLNLNKVCFSSLFSQTTFAQSLIHWTSVWSRRSRLFMGESSRSSKEMNTVVKNMWFDCVSM